MGSTLTCTAGHWQDPLVAGEGCPSGAFEPLLPERHVSVSDPASAWTFLNHAGWKTVPGGSSRVTVVGTCGRRPHGAQAATQGPQHPALEELL